MRRVLIVSCCSVAWMLAGASTFVAAESNPLIGKWRFSGQGYVDREGHNWCNVIVEIDFDRNSKTVVTAPGSGSQRTTTPAYYAVYGDKIYVSGTDGLLEGPYFTMIDGNHMQDDTVGHCVYQRD